jgi:hypothetical protein
MTSFHKAVRADAEQVNLISAIIGKRLILMQRDAMNLF